MSVATGFEARSPVIEDVNIEGSFGIYQGFDRLLGGCEDEGLATGLRFEGYLERASTLLLSKVQDPSERWVALTVLWAQIFRH